MENQHTYSQQDITFKIAELLEHSLDIRYTNTDVDLNAYAIESVLAGCVESLGLKLFIEDMPIFECNISKDGDSLPF